MALPDIDTVLSWRGRRIIDRSGEKIGRFEDIYLDTRSCPSGPRGRRP